MTTALATTYATVAEPADVPYGLMALVAGVLFALAVGWMVMRNVLLDGGGRR